MGWTDLMAATDLEPGQIRAVSVADRDLVVWRDRHGTAAVMDARCPHQWSHLEAEGFVDGDEIVCTAHFWRFDRQGCGTKLSILGRRDPKSDIETFASRERDGRIEARLDL